MPDKLRVIGDINNLIKEDRAPLATDAAIDGTLWINTTTNKAYTGIKQTDGTMLWTEGGGGELTFKNQGVTLGTGKIVDFTGANINAEKSGDTIIVSSPPYAYAPKYNAGAATVPDVSTSSRNVSAPTVEGTPFKIGDWVAGTAHPCLRTSPLVYNTPALCGFENNTTTTIEVKVFDADGTTALATHLTAAITGNGSWTVQNITITVADWAADGTKYKANINVSIALATILPAGGRFGVSIVHHNVADYTKAQSNVFYDLDNVAASLSGVTIAETGGSVVTKNLSGVKFYNLNSQFTANIADIDQLNNMSYPANQVTLEGAEYGLPTQNIPGSSLTGWTNAYNDENDSYQKTDIAITQANYRALTTTANIRARVEDWSSGAWINSSDASLLIDTYAQESTDLAEYFTDEAYRRTSAGALWDSSQNLTTYDGGTGAQVVNGLLQVPVDNYSTYAPAGSPNYTGGAAPKDYRRRIIDASGLVRNSASIAITGFTLADLVASRVEMWINIPGRFTSPCYAHTASLFDSGTFDGDNDPIRLASSSSGIINVSFGTLGLDGTHTYFELRIVINDASIKPSSIIVSW